MGIAFGKMLLCVSGVMQRQFRLAAGANPFGLGTATGGALYETATLKRGQELLELGPLGTSASHLPAEYAHALTCLDPAFLHKRS